MLEGKKGGLSVFVEQTKLVGDVVVGLCFPLECNGCSLAKLHGGPSCNSDCFPAGSEEAALGYSLFLAVQQVLCGDPLAVSKTKVGSVSCVGHNGMFGINWKVKGTGSAVRKSIGLALKVLDPVRTASTYARCVKVLGGSVDKESFMYVADSAAKGIKSSLQVGIVGNIKLDSGKLDAMLDVLAKKHGVTDGKGSKSKPSGHTPCDHSNHTDIKSAGWSSSVFSDYVQFKAKGLVPLLCDKSLLVPLKSSQWDTLASKLKKGVKDYVAAKYTRVGDDLPAIFGYLSLSSSSLCSSDVKSAINNKLSAASIDSAITKHL